MRLLRQTQFIVQSVLQTTSNQGVPGSSPGRLTKYYENFGEDTSTGSTGSCADLCAEESAFGAGFERWVTPIDVTADLMQAGCSITVRPLQVRSLAG